MSDDGPFRVETWTFASKHLTLQQVMTHVIGREMHPAEVCTALERLLNGADAGDSMLALSICRAVMCRLELDTFIPAMPKWV